MRPQRQRASTSATTSAGSRPRRRRRCAISTPKLTPWQKTQVARHPQRPHCLDYVNALIHGVHAARRRPQVRRGRGDRRRLRPLPRREHLRHRPREGLDHRKPAQAQFRHGAAGGLSQGRAADGDGRPLRPAGAGAGRHRGRLSRHRRRGARPGRGDRALDRRLPQSGRAQCRGDPRRRRLGRRRRDRHRQPGADAGAFDLHRDLAGGRGLDPVARHRQGAGRRHQHEDHRRRTCCASASSTASSPSRSAAPTAIRPPPSPPPARRSPPPSPNSGGSTAKLCGGSAGTSSWRSAGGSNSPGPRRPPLTFRFPPRPSATGSIESTIESHPGSANSVIILPFVHPSHAQSDCRF